LVAIAFCHGAACCSVRCPTHHDVLFDDGLP